MIVGTGIDLIEISRIEKACTGDRFPLRVYTETECRQAGGRASVLAGSFAVKEAVAKALGTGFRGFWLNDIEVLRDELGKPYVKLSGGARERAKEIGADRIHVSITDTKVYAQAIAVAESIEEKDEKTCDRNTDEGD